VTTLVNIAKEREHWQTFIDQEQQSCGYSEYCGSVNASNGRLAEDGCMCVAFRLMNIDTDNTAQRLHYKCTRYRLTGVCIKLSKRTLLAARGSVCQTEILYTNAALWPEATFALTSFSLFQSSQYSFRILCISLYLSYSAFLVRNL
jgi:hypothetical protein